MIPCRIGRTPGADAADATSRGSTDPHQVANGRAGVQNLRRHFFVAISSDGGATPTVGVSAVTHPWRYHPVSGQPTVQDHAPAQAPRAAASASGRRAADRIRPSNCHVPVALIKPLEELCARTGMSHGDAIIAAIEHAYPRLAELIEPAGVTGGHVGWCCRRCSARRCSDSR